MNKTLKMVLAAAGALVLGGLGEGIGSALLNKAAKTEDTDADAEDTNEENTAEEEPIVDVEVSEEETED